MSKNGLVLGRYDWAVFLGLFSEAFSLQVVPVILLAVSNDLGFPLAEGGFVEGGLIQMFSGLTGALMMLFGAFIANRYGKRFTYTLSIFLLFAGVAALGGAGSYPEFVLYMMLAGAGGNLLIGMAPALAHDLHLKDSGRYITIANSFWSGGMLLTVLLSGYLLAAGFSWRTVLFIGAASVLLPLILLLLPVTAEKRFPDSSRQQSLAATFRSKVVVLKCRRFWLFVVAISLVAGSELVIGLWTASYIQLSFGASAQAGGIAVGCFAAGMILSRGVSGYFIRQEKIRYFIIWYAATAAILTAALPLVDSLYLFYVLLFVSGLAIAPLWPCIQSYSVDQLAELDKTVVLMLLTICGIAAYSFFSWFTGFMAAVFDSLKPVYYMVPLNYLLAVLVLCFAGRQEASKAVESGLVE